MAPTPNQETLRLMRQVQEALYALDAHLNNQPYDQHPDNGYPFHESLDEVAANVAEWCWNYIPNTL